MMAEGMTEAVLCEAFAFGGSAWRTATLGAVTGLTCHERLHPP
jgi:hypothetical protein